MQGIDIADYKRRLLKGTQQIFSFRQVNTRLSSYRRIYHSQQGSGHLNIGYSTQVCCRRKACDISHDTAAQCNDNICAAKLIIYKKIDEIKISFYRLTFFTGGKDK